MAKRSTVISLLDVVLYLQHTVAYIQAARRNPRNPAVDPNWRRYDSGAFMTAILKDVFDNTAETEPSKYLVEAKAILQNAGLNHSSAHELCNRIFDQITDTLSAHLPHLVLHDVTQEVHADMIGNWDVMITEFSDSCGYFGSTNQIKL